MKTLINKLFSNYLGYIFIKKPNTFLSLKNVFGSFNLIVDVGVANGTRDLYVISDSKSTLFLIDPFLEKFQLNELK